MTLLLLAPSPASAQETQFQPTWYMVVDRANLLDEGQERSAIDDAWRLNTIGTPTQVVTELTQSTPELASQRAAELRIANAIESSPGADDGVLVYAAVNPGNRAVVEVAISLGANAVPRGAFTLETAQSIRTDIVQPQLQAENPARAIVYSLREIHYLQIFAPPPVESLEGWRATLHSIMLIAAPVAAALTASLLVVRLKAYGRLREALVPLSLAAGATLLLGALSMMGRSSPGILSALLLAAVVVWLAIRLDQSPPASTARTIAVTPRPPDHMRPSTGASSR
jgi:hypothetical protein